MTLVVLQTVQAYLRVEEILDRLDSGRLAPPDASLKERLAWVWRCHLHYWAFRYGEIPGMGRGGLWGYLL